MSTADMAGRAYIITGRNELSKVETNLPDSPLPGHATVEIAFTGVCASDIDAYRKGYQYHPTLSGHEWSGRVVAVGDGVSALSPGDRVSRTCQVACGTCRMCRAGHQVLCDFFSLSSVPTAPHHGAYATHIHVPASGLIALPAAMSDEGGAMVEPAAVAFHAVRRSGARPGDVVLLIGAGAIGLFALQMALLSGAAHVVVVEPDPARRSVASALGATAAFAPEDAGVIPAILEVSGGRGADIAYECAGQGASLMGVVDKLRPGGRLMMISAPSSPVEIIPAMWTSKELDVMTARAHSRDEFDVVIELFRQGRLTTAGVSTTTVGLSELPSVFERIEEHASAHRVLVDPRR